MRACLALLLLLGGACAHADWQTRSWSRWEIGSDGAEALVGVERAELQRLPGAAGESWLASEIRATIAFHDGERACALADLAPVPADAGVLALRARFRCVAPLVAPRVEVRLFLGFDRAPLHHAQFRHADGRREEALFTRAQTGHALAVTPRRAAPAGTLALYLGLGFHHILIGLDHVAFLLCMLLAAERLSSRLWMITGFTLGHSITLSLGVLGLLSVRASAVEALIGYTVALLAAEAALRRGARYAGWTLWLVVALLGAWSLRADGALGAPVALALLVLTPAYLALARRSAGGERLHLGMTAVFGLVHGLGFAGVLLALGVPAQQRGWALAGFNLGVELGQLALLGGFALALGAVRRLASPGHAHEATQGLAIALCAVGVYWLAGRSLLA